MSQYSVVAVRSYGKICSFTRLERELPIRDIAQPLTPPLTAALGDDDPLERAVQTLQHSS